MECLINTTNHAYSSQAKYSKWWMIALPEPARNRVHFTTLDNGFGIPYTVRKNYNEKIQKLFGKHLLKSSNIDSELIRSALEGELRTRTGKTYRGTGLPSLFELTEIPNIKNLRIISNHGHLLAGENKIISKIFRLQSRFHGTLISWDFVE